MSFEPSEGNPHYEPSQGLAISTLDLLMHLNLQGTDPNLDLLRSKILAATAQVENQLGYPLDDFEDGTPEPVLEAVRQLAGHLFENREPMLIGQGIDAQELPFGVNDLLSAYKKWVF